MSNNIVWMPGDAQELVTREGSGIWTHPFQSRIGGVWGTEIYESLKHHQILEDFATLPHLLLIQAQGLAFYRYTFIHPTLLAWNSLYEGKLAALCGGQNREHEKEDLRGRTPEIIWRSIDEVFYSFDNALRIKGWVPRKEDKLWVGV